MTLAFLSFGHGSLTGKAAVNQAIAFKRQLRAVLPFVDGISPMIVPDPETHQCEVRVAYERGNQQAAAWVKQAEELAPGLWDSLVEVRKETIRT